MPTVQITLNRAGVAAPVQLAAIASSDVIAAGLTAFAADTLAKPTLPDQFPELQIRGPEMTSGQRRTMYQNWLLAAGFQSLVRGTRESLEEAAVYLKLLSEPPKIPTSATWEDVLASVRKPASKLSFPDLLATVNAGLSSPLDFEREFLSMQKVRNCLEHRAGVVRKQDLDEDGAALTLSFPRLKVFYMRGDKEIELARDERVDARDGQPTVQVSCRTVTRSRAFQLGERVMFTPGEFSEIAMACSFFGCVLASKLPAVAAP